MENSLHHVHIFASDIERTIGFYTELLGAEVVLDAQLAGARNVFLRIGKGRLHLYDQPPKHPVRGNIHHFGILTDDIDGVVQRMRDKGVPFTKGITDLGFWKYIMVPAPDGILIELFQVDKGKVPESMKDYFP
jgi:catechol 2,3-dioxygenase-like lactoylglutathione lyase family enzyme